MKQVTTEAFRPSLSQSLLSEDCDAQDRHLLVVYTITTCTGCGIPQYVSTQQAMIATLHVSETLLKTSIMFVAVPLLSTQKPLG